jgi:hypothetical protein
MSASLSSVIEPPAEYRSMPMVPAPGSIVVASAPPTTRLRSSMA